MSYEFGDVVLVRFPQSGGRGPKQRPALVVLDFGDSDVVLAPITSVDHGGPGDLAIRDWQAAGLLRTSWVRLGKIAAIEKVNVSKTLGRILEADKTAMRTAWQGLYRL